MVQQDREEKPEAGTPRQRHERALARSNRRVRAFMTLLLLGLWATGAMAAETYGQPTERRAAVVAQAKNGTALLALPLDHLLWTPAADWRSQELKASYKVPGFTGQFDVWLTGTVSPLARQQLTKRGMSVTEEVYKRVEIVD